MRSIEMDLWSYINNSVAYFEILRVSEVRYRLRKSAFIGRGKVI